MKERSECKLPASSSHVIHDELRSLGRGKQLMCRLNRLSSVLALSKRAQGRPAPVLA
jgi:hypothetical protein